MAINGKFGGYNFVFENNRRFVLPAFTSEMGLYFLRPVGSPLLRGEAQKQIPQKENFICVEEEIKRMSQRCEIKSTASFTKKYDSKSLSADSLLYRSLRAWCTSDANWIKNI